MRKRITRLKTVYKKIDLIQELEKINQTIKSKRTTRSWKHKINQNFLLNKNQQNQNGK